MPLSPGMRKQLGSFYTDERAVRFLVGWGVGNVSGRRVMDPSCGDGRFLLAAAALDAESVVGCDLDSHALDTASQSLATSSVSSELHRCDFFELSPGFVDPVDLVVGNPPYVRFQSFSGRSRLLALESAMEFGVRLPGLTSTWAPFLLHSLHFLKAGGAMAVVVPAELLHCGYGILTLRALCGKFSKVHLTAFSRNIFPDAEEETLLLRASGFGGQSTFLTLLPLDGIEDLTDTIDETTASVIRLPERGKADFAQAFLTREEWENWRNVSSRERVMTLAECGSLTNGFVTGANSFFLRMGCSPEDGMPREWLRPVATKASSIRGIEFTFNDICRLERGGSPHHLLDLPEDDLLLTERDTLLRLVEQGESLGLHRRFKCRVRDPWWRVPGVRIPDVLIPYMIGRKPVCSVNRAGAAYTNTLHGIKVKSQVSPESIAVSMLSSLSLLSMELVGRSYGGGLLKLEPSEAGAVSLVDFEAGNALFRKMDAALRSGCFDEAVASVDDEVLGHGLSLPERSIALLKSARRKLLDRRYDRNGRPLRNAT